MLCRLCLKHSKTLFNLINSDLKCAELSAIESLYWIFGVEVDVRDPYSKYICEKCCRIVEYIGTYRGLYQRNQLILQGKLDYRSEVEEWSEENTKENEPNSTILNTPAQTQVSPRPKRRRVKLIKHCGTPIKNKTSTRTEQATEMENKPIENNLILVSEEIEVKVCKYCSKVCSTKQQLDIHLNTKHEQQLVAKLKKRGKRKKTLRYTKIKNRSRTKYLIVDSSGIAGGENSNKVSEPATVGKRRKSLSLDPKILDTAKQPDVLDNNHVNVTENEKKLVINDKKRTEIGSKTQALKTISLGGFPNDKQNIITLNCKYKWLHLKDFDIPVARCAISTKLYHNLASGLQKIDSSGINMERKGNVKKISKHKTHTWKENISATLLALQQIARNESKEQRLHNSEVSVVVRNGSSETSNRNSDKTTTYNLVLDKDTTDKPILNNNEGLTVKELVRNENVTTPNSTSSTEDLVNQSEKEKFKNNRGPNQKSEKHQITPKSCSNTSGIDRRTSAVDTLSDSSEDSQENSNVGQQKSELDKKTEPRQHADKIAEKVQMKKMHKLEEKKSSKLNVGNSEADLMENCDTEGALYSVKAEGFQKTNQHSGTSRTKLIDHGASRKNLSAKKNINEGGTGYEYKENVINYNKIELSERRIKVVPTKNCNDKSERNGDISCVVSTNIKADINDNDISSESETEGLRGFEDTDDSDDENIPAETEKVIASSPCSVKDLPITNSAVSNNSSSGTNAVFVLKDSSDVNLKDCIVSIERCAVPDTLIQRSKELEDVVEVLDEGEKEQNITQLLCEKTNPNKGSNRRTTQKDHVILSINDSGLKDKIGVLPNKMVTKNNRKKAQSSEILNTEIIDCTKRRQGILEYTSDGIKKNSETCPKNETVVTVNIKRGYRSLNLKDFNIYVKRCAVPPGRIPCKENKESKLNFKQNGDLLAVTEEDSRIRELQDVHDDTQSQDPLSEDERCTNDDDSLKNLGEPLQIPSTENTAFVGNLQKYSLQSLNDQYKWLNLKDFSIYIERCEIPETNHGNTNTVNEDATITESQYREVHLRGNAEHYELDIEFGDENCEGDETGEEISNDFCLHSKSQQNKMIELKDLTSWQKQIEQAIQLVRSVRDNASNQHKSKITNMKLLEKDEEDVSTAFTPDSNILMASNNMNVDYQENNVEITSNIPESCIEPQCFEDDTVAKNHSVTTDSTDLYIEERRTETIDADTLPDTAENHSIDAKTITISENVLKYEPSGENSDTMTEIQKRKKHISETLQKIKRIKEVQEKLKNSKVYQMVTEQSISVPRTDTTLARGYSTKAVSDVEKDANATIEIEQCKDNPLNPEACSQSETCNAKKKMSKRKLKNGTAKHTCLLHGSNEVISKFICSTDVRVPSTDDIMEDLASSQRQVPEKGGNKVHCSKSVGKSCKSRKKHRESVSTDETKRLTRDVEQLSKLLQLLKLIGNHKTATEVEELNVPVADSTKETSDVISYQPNLKIQDNENDDTEPQEQDRQDLETNSNDGDLEEGATCEQSSNCSNTADTRLVINIVTETEALVTESTESQCVSGTSHQYSSSCETSECSLEKDDLSIPLLDVDQIREDCLPSQLN